MSSRTVGNKKMFEKYKEVLQRLEEALDIYKNSLETVENCLEFKDFEDLMYWAKRADVCFFLQIVIAKFVSQKFVSVYH